jgi:hypothetical protein
MYQPNRVTRVAGAALMLLGLAVMAPAAAQPAHPAEPASQSAGPTKHEYQVSTSSLRGATFVCGDLTLRVTRGRETEVNDADLRDGVARLYTSRIQHGVRLRGSDGRTYRASGVTAAWFVFDAPDFETPEHGLEIIEVMFRGGPDKSPGWLRERIAWAHQHETDRVHGPCTFG